MATILSTPVITPALRLIAVVCAKLSGWTMTCEKPVVKKAIFIGAPHTSNWDFLVMVMGILIWRIDIHWLGKHTLFIGPLGPIMRWLGGIPIDRGNTRNFVDQMICKFDESQELLLIIAPEGTRSPVERWRSGFYYIAHGAGIPLVLSYIDYASKEIGIEAIEQPSGDFENDMARYHAFYASKTGKNPQNYSSYLKKD